MSQICERKPMQLSRVSIT